MIIRSLKQVKAGLPPGTQVRVLADRGIGTSPLLMRGIMALKWTFLFRVTKQSKMILPSGEAICFYDQVTAPGHTYHASGRVSKKRGRIPSQAQDRWALVTNDSALSGWEYAQRMWMEQAFRDLKSHGWQVESACVSDPHRIARLWILLVVAYAWMLLLGTACIAAGRGVAPKRRTDGTYVRRWSVFREGRRAFFAAASPD
jgi:hypothetical protein